jgi:hypothetical protein
MAHALAGAVRVLRAGGLANLFLWKALNALVAVPRQTWKKARMAKARKAKPSPKSRVAAQPSHTWKVTRRDGQILSVSADDLSVVDGELVFAVHGVPVRIIAADTYTDVEIVATDELVHVFPEQKTR